MTDVRNKQDKLWPNVHRCRKKKKKRVGQPFTDPLKKGQIPRAILLIDTTRRIKHIKEKPELGTTETLNSALGSTTLDSVVSMTQHFA